MKAFYLAGLATLTVTLAAGNVAAQTDTLDTARLYIRAADRFTLVCAAPCTADIPQNSELRTTLNNNDDEPHTFTVPSDAGPEVDLEVKPASAAPVIGGIIFMGSGGVSSSSYSSSSYQKSQSDELKTTGYGASCWARAACQRGAASLASECGVRARRDCVRGHGAREAA